MAAVRLARGYRCRDGAPVIHSFDPAIFSLRYFMRCMACGFCNDQCCDHGVDIDAANAERLLALGPEFEARVALPPSEWFTEDPVRDAEFPSGAHVRTAVRNGKCVFISAAGRGCTIHAYCIEKGIDYHSLKPMVSTLFPLTFEHGVLVPSSEAVDGSLICSGAGATLYEGVRGELEFYFGSGLVAELDSMNLVVMARDSGPPR
jgi:hypothetical protein